MGSPRSPSARKTRLRLPWKKRGTRKSPRERLKFWPSGDFARLMSSKDKKKSRKGSASSKGSLRDSMKKEVKEVDEEVQEDSVETDFCIKGHDYLVRTDISALDI